MIYCPNCGNQNAENSQFCVHCGSGLGAAPGISGPAVGAPVKKAGKKNTLVIALLAVAIIVAGGVMFLPFGDNDPAACLDKFFNACGTKNARLASDYLSVLANYSGDVDGVKQWVQDKNARETQKQQLISRTISEVDDTEIVTGKVVKKGKLAIVTCKVTEYNKDGSVQKSGNINYLMVKEGGNYRLWRKIGLAVPSDDLIKVYQASGIH